MRRSDARQHPPQLVAIAEASIARSRNEQQTMPAAVMQAVREVMDLAPGLAESDAFALVWSVWPTPKGD